MRRIRSIPAFAAALVTGAVVGPVAPSADAQYFGRNKMQYETLEFRVLKTEHFDIHYYEEEREAAEIAARLAERWYWRLSRLLNHDLRGRQALLVYASHPHFQQTNAISGDIGEGTGGVTEAFKRRIVLPFAGPLAETDHVLGHELVHAFQFDMTGPAGPVSAGGGPGALSLPLWFIEGMAEYLSVGPVDPHTAMWMRDAVREDRLPSVERLADPRFFPYRWGQALWAYVGGRYGDDVAGQLLKAAGRQRDVRRAFQQVLGVSLDTLSAEWHEALRAAYRPVVEAAEPPSAYGRPVLTGRSERARLNLAPALSPDGSRLVFFSERDLFSIELFLADARSGDILKKITKTAVDPHFESLQFISSAGTWDPEGRQFAFGAVSGGRPVLSILDAVRGDVVREIRFADLGEIFNPAWSPDGRWIAFSAIVGGLSDLFLFDLDGDTLTRLTNDPWADLQPAWSADGASLLFVTDRFGGSLGDLLPGSYRLATFDLATRAIAELPGVGDAKHINPQVAADGTIYFLSDLGGVTNLYRMAPDGSGAERLTRLAAGVSGITALSPALSVARSTGSLAFSVYGDGRYAIYVVDDPLALSGEPAEAALAGPDAGVLPPARERSESRVLAMLDDHAMGLPGDSAFTVQDYSAKLSLDYVAPPSVVVGADRFGTFVGGGSALFFSDMLGNRNLATMLQVYGTFEDLAALVAYQNQARRLNWGVAAQQVPFLTGAFALGQTREGNLLQLTQRFRQTDRQVAGIAAYPLSRVQRVEFTAGLRNISFDVELDSLVVSPTGAVLLDRTVDLGAPDAISLGQASGALVYDNSFFGAASPILGQRYRLELAQTTGSLHFSTVLADYRRYLLPVRPFTVAARLVHYGRYGGEAEDPRLRPLYVGYQSLVRGYDIGSFSASECGPAASTTGLCPVFDQLLGSRIAVANLELRFPLLGLLGVGGGYYGAFPIETAVFADAGIAYESGSVLKWNRDPGDLGIRVREPVTSIGFAARINLFGFAIAEIDYVKPFNRPDKGWYLQFGFTPGF